MPTTQGRKEAGPGPRLISHETRIKTARNGRVSGALDDGPTIGKKGDLIIAGPEFQDKVRMPHLAVRMQRAAQRREIHRALLFMNLNRVPSAQRDARSPLATKMHKLALA